MWTATEKGSDEARIFAMMDLIKNNLGIFNTVLTYDGLWPSQFEITASMVHYGDVDILKDRATHPMLFCVEGAEFDCRIRRDTVENTYTNGTLRNFETNIIAYIHPQTMLPADYEARREQLISRVCDWLTDGLFNYRSNQVLPMASHVFTPPTENDKLRGLIEEVRKDWFNKCPGGMLEVRGAVLTHRGYLG